MLNEIPEIKKELSDIKIGKSRITGNSLSRLISAWVSGKDLRRDIAGGFWRG